MDIGASEVLGIVAGGGIGSGPLTLKINWSSMRLKPWPPYDMAKAIAVATMVIAGIALPQRRLALRG